MKRRDLVFSAAALAVVRPALALPEELERVLRDFAKGATVREGRVLLDIAPLIDNGNVVPVSVSVQSPMTAADHVREIAIFNQRNPQRDVARFALSPRNGVAKVSTRIRLATSQQLLAVARMHDGACFTHTVEVVVVLAACIE